MLIDETDDAEPDEGDAAPEAGPTSGPKLRYSDADFLRLVDDECRRSVGFGEGDTGELARVRIKAQEYRQGKINDLPVLAGRSSAVDTSLAEAVDTVIPDIMEVFFGGDDVVTFKARGQDDEGPAREETDAVTDVIFQDNEAFRAFHDAIQDALLNRTGLFHWWWEEEEAQIGEHQAEGEGEAQALAAIAGMSKPWAKAQVEPRDDGSFAVVMREQRGRVCFKAIPSEDFTVAADTVSLRDTGYCALRDRPRVQDLIARGVDRKRARALPQASSRQDQMDQARNEAGENDRDSGGQGIDDLRVVEVRTHYLRVDADDDGDIEIWRIETDAEQRILLQKEQVSQVPFGALTPYLSAHRFYGESLADKLFEVMRIKTVLLRMLLDSGYFALNNRMEVSEDQASEFTIADLLNNAPNVPVRSRTGTAVRPISTGGLGFDVMGAMEFMSTVAEQRSGVVRNAQGLNPDTLHDTAAGAMQLIGVAQKRVRFICRVFAETGVKDLILGAHQMMRENSGPDYAPLNLKSGQTWKEVRPGEWAERAAVTVHVGVGSGGKDREIAGQSKGLEVTQSVIELQGGLNGPLVTAQNAFNRLKAFSRAIGDKDSEQYWSDPTQAQPQAGAAPPPDPEMLKAQQEMALEQAKIAAQSQADQLRAANDLAIARQRMAMEMQARREQAAQDLALKREELAAKTQLQREQASAELEMRRQIAVLQAQTAPATGGVDQVHVGGEPG